MEEGIGDRVARAIPHTMTQKQVASAVGMTPDAFSRALRGERGFAAVELANLAEVLSQDVHFLITGQPDPHRLVVSARHSYDPQTRSRAVEGRERDDAVLADIALAFRQGMSR